MGQHLETHAEERPFECIMCNKNFTNMEEFDDQMLDHSEGLFECPICNEEFPDQATREDHDCEGLYPIRQTWQCENCDMVFEDEDSLEEHMEQYMASWRTCFRCGAEFPDRDSLERHDHECLY